MNLDKIKEEVVAFLFTKGVDVAGATIILVVGAIIAGWIGRRVEKWLGTKNLEPPIRTLLVRLCKLLVFGLAIVLAVDKLGVPTGPVITGLGVVGVGVGLALQGVLGNLAAGLTIIFTKPFRVGEYIELLGVSGQITEIELLSTKLAHADKSVVIIPNRKIIGEVLHNFGKIRQLTLNAGVAYGSDLPLVLSTVREVLARNPRVLKDPAASVGITALQNSSINIAVQPWVNVADFGQTQLEIYEDLVAQFRARKIELPFPQHEVRLLNPPTEK